MKLFVWDFHGVLEKDNEKAVLSISNQALEKNGYKERFLYKDIDKLYGLKWYQYFKYLIPSLSEQECLKLQSACFEDQLENQSIIQSLIKPTEYAIKVLRSIEQSGHRQILISNTRPDDIIWFLESVDQKGFFDDERIFGVNSHQTHNTKSDALQKYLSGKNFDKIICIGDSEDDLILGKEFNAVTYYYQHKDRRHIETKNADYIINDLREILKEIE